MTKPTTEDEAKSSKSNPFLRKSTISESACSLELLPASALLFLEPEQLKWFKDHGIHKYSHRSVVSR